MVGTSKILTVSYGTFSCTLEGFDDSFEMMKAISEYFRDLAADDRYFGAEPPKLDGEMLAQLAARRSAIAIAAEQSGDRVVLRPAPAPAVAAPQLQTPVPQPEQAAQPAPSVQPAAKAPADDNSIAARLQRIRSVVAGADTAAQDFSEDQHAELFLTAAAFMATPATNAMPEQADLASLAADIAADIGEDEDTGEDTFSAIQAAARDAAQDSAEQPTEHTADDSTDTTIDDIAEDSPETTLHNTMAGFGADIDAQPPTPPTPQHAEGIDAAGLLDRGAMSGAGPDAAATWTPASAMAAAGPENDHDEDMIEIETLDEDDTGNAQPAPDAEPRLRVMKMCRADFEAAVAAGRLEPMDEEDDEDAASLWAPEATAEWAEGGEVTSSLPAEDEADLRANWPKSRPSSRVHWPAIWPQKMPISTRQTAQQRPKIMRFSQICPPPHPPRSHGYHRPAAMQICSAFWQKQIRKWASPTPPTAIRPSPICAQPLPPPGPTLPQAARCAPKAAVRRIVPIWPMSCAGAGPSASVTLGRCDDGTAIGQRHPRRAIALGGRTARRYPARAAAGQPIARTNHAGAPTPGTSAGTRAAEPSRWCRTRPRFC